MSLSKFYLRSLICALALAAVSTAMSLPHVAEKRNTPLAWCRVKNAKLRVAKWRNNNDEVGTQFVDRGTGIGGLFKVTTAEDYAAIMRLSYCDSDPSEVTVICPVSLPLSVRRIFINHVSFRRAMATPTC